MNKKIIGYAFVVILVGLTAFIFIKKNKKTTLESESGDFKYNDTASITKIFIAEKNGNTATLERKDKGNWTINEAYPARKNNVNLLLYTLKQIAVKYPASEKLQPTIIQSIATVGKKIEFYSGTELVKVWYMGSTSSDHTGTYMVLADPESGEKYEQTYVTYIPGFEGFLNTRFFTDQNNWKDQSILKTTPPEIASVRVEHTGLPDSSFIINVLGVNKFTLTDLNNKPVQQLDTFSIKQYLSYCTFLEVDKYLTGKSDREIDSVKKSIPFTTITIKLKNGKEQNMKLFSKKPAPDAIDETLGMKLLKDPDHAFMLFNKDQEFALVQYLIFGKLIQSRQYFLKSGFVKK